MSNVPFPHRDDTSGDVEYADYDYEATLGRQASNGKGSNSLFSFEQQGRYGANAPNAVGRAAPVVQIAKEALGSQQQRDDDFDGSFDEDASGNSARYVNVPLTFEWSGPPSKISTGASAAAAASVKPKNLLEVAPFPKVLQSMGLSPKERFNVKEMYVKSITNLSRVPVAIMVRGLNGEDLVVDHHQDGQVSTLVIDPHQSVNYSKLNGGRGHLLASNSLDMHGEVNVGVSPTEMLSAAKPHETDPTKLVTKLDLSGYADPNNKTPLKSVSKLGLLILANGKKQLLQDPNIPEYIRENLPPLTDKEARATSMLTGMVVRPDFQDHTYNVMVDAEQLRNLAHEYGNKNAASAQPTSAADHKIQVFRLGGAPDEHIGDISRAMNVTKADIDRAEQTTTGIVMQLGYVLQHPGTPFKPETK